MLENTGRAANLCQSHQQKPIDPTTHPPAASSTVSAYKLLAALGFAALPNCCCAASSSANQARLLKVSCRQMVA
jgi:hypothetical protein